MRAAVYRGVNDLQIEELPVPKIKAGELLVKVAVCGVCPTDIKKIHYGTVPPPRIFGHETAGTIVQVGAGVKGFRVGERVGLHHHVPCLKCHACRHRAFAQCPTYKRTGITAGFEPAGGGFAEYVRVMDFVLPGVVKIPKGNDFEEGALLEPVNTVLKGVRRLQLQKGDTVLVAGQGPIGLLFTKLLRLEGARVVVTDLVDTRREGGIHWGAQAAFHPEDTKLKEWVDKATRGRGVDGVVVAVPVGAAVAQAFQLACGAGKILLFAHTKRGESAPIDLASVCVDEKDLIGSYSSDFLLQKEVANMVFSRKLDVRKLISHRYPLAETGQAVALAAKPTPESLKVVVKTG